MTDAIAAFSLSVPANGNVNNLSFVNCPLGPSDVTHIMIVFPPGCAGNVGARVDVGGSQAYPLSNNTFFILDDYTLEFDVSNQVNSGSWRFGAYNTDTFIHKLTIYFYFNYVNFTKGQSLTQLVSL